MRDKTSPINSIWLAMILTSIAAAAWGGTMNLVTSAVFDSAKAAVTLAIGLIGAMAFWLGVMKVMEEAGALRFIARTVRPLMTRLFPDVPAEHPAMSAMIMNMAANMLGLGNAATPFGIKAMVELDRLNKDKGTATNAMCLFLAINTSNVTLLPLGVITVRAAAGATHPAAILLPSILATSFSTIAALIAAKLLQRGKTGSAQPSESDPVAPEPAEEVVPAAPASIFRKAVVLGFVAVVAAGMIYRVMVREGAFVPETLMGAASTWLIPLIVATFLLIGYVRGVKVYETVTEGAKEGFNVAIRIIPFLVAIFVAVGMLRSSGALGAAVTALGPITSLIGMPAESLTVALLRPLSGSGSFAVMSEIVAREPNSFLSFLVSTMQGSTETTFYVAAVYFGAVGVRRTRHAIPAALIADATGVIAAVTICRIFW